MINKMSLHSFKTFTRVLNNMPKSFPELYLEAFHKDSMGLSEDVSLLLEPSLEAYKKFNFENYGERLELIACIQIKLVSLFQNKENILNLMKRKQKELNDSFYDIIMSGDLNKQKELYRFLKEAEYENGFK